jgi:hypothetical protein
LEASFIVYLLHDSFQHSASHPMPMVNREQFLSGSECPTANPAALSSDMTFQLVKSPVESAFAATVSLQGQCH